MKPWRHYVMVNICRPAGGPLKPGVRQIRDDKSGDRRDVPIFDAGSPGLRPDTSGPLDSRGGCPYMSTVLTMEQQVPPLRRRVRSGSGRNDKKLYLSACIIGRKVPQLCWQVARSIPVLGSVGMFTRHRLGPANKLDCPHAMGTKSGDRRDVPIFDAGSPGLRPRYFWAAGQPGGCPYMSTVLTVEQQVPPLRRRVRSGSGRNDKRGAASLRAGWGYCMSSLRGWSRVLLADEEMDVNLKIPTSRAKGAREMGHPAFGVYLSCAVASAMTASAAA
jgi:hypothetical protein